MEKTARITTMDSTQPTRDRLAYWRSRPPAERLAAIERLRRHEHGSLPRLQKVVRVLKFGER